jgi:hypothetical protein
MSARFTSPLPLTMLVTSYSTHVPLETAPLSSSAPEMSAGRLFHVNPVSVQLPVPHQASWDREGSAVRYTRCALEK